MSTANGATVGFDTHIELHFPLVGQSVAREHGYELAGAISRAMEEHPPEGVAIGKIGGLFSVGERLALGPESVLRMRMPVGLIGKMIGLAGATLAVGRETIVLGTPTVRAITPAPRLRARMVTIKGFTEPGPFLEAVRRQMEALGVVGEAAIPEVRGGPYAGKPVRRVLRVKGRTVVGFAVVVDGLADRDSLVLQAFGIGGRRHMGCGIFVPVSEEGRMR